MMLSEREQQLLMRGLDAELSRVEMRQLYRLVAHHREAQQEMADLVALEESLLDLDEVLEAEQPSAELDHRINQLIMHQEMVEKTRLHKRVWSWLQSPQGIVLQPFSFLGGGIVAALLLWFFLPQSNQHMALQTARLNILDVPFIQVKANVNWTNRIIVQPGERLLVRLDQPEGEAVVMRLEALQPTPVIISHALRNRSESQQIITVNGIRYASLHAPRQGDQVVLQNHGEAPVLLFTRLRTETSFEQQKTL
ncbi:hypothetical protein ACQZV8_06450 [Magnetococcales bacterium HHB-1]